MIEVIRRRYGWEVPNNWYVWIVIVCLMMGMFSAWRDEHTKAQPRIGEEVQAKIDSLTQANQQLQQKVETLQRQQRQLTPRQIVKRKEFLSALREAGPVMLDIACMAGDKDAADLYTDLHYLLLAGGWVIKDKRTVNGTPWTGVRVAVKDRNVPPSGAVLMVELLQQNGIAGYLVETPALALDMFSVEIGYKP